MKHKKSILILSIFIIIFIYIISPFINENQESLKYNLIRFHIRANSDLVEDQALKLKVRDEILKVMESKFASSKSLDESREIIKNNMDEMKAITERVIATWGKDYDVAVTLGQDNFPTRKYGDLVLPTGEYETLLITIGEGKGQNWWCIMFPPLCFVDITNSIAFNIEDQIETKLNETPTLKLKWKTADILNKFKEKINISFLSN